MARTALFVQKQSGGIFAVEDMASSTGNRFFVDSGSAGNGSTASFGKSPDAPFDQIESVNNAGVLTANNGDIVIVMPGHAETVDAAADLDCDVAGVTYLGIGDGASQPTITFGTTAAADIDIDAANVTFKNLHFVSAIADVTAAIDVNADDFTLKGCRFSEDTNLNFLICVQDAASGGSDRITIEGCHAICTDAANTHFVNFAGTGTGHIVRNNRLIGDWGTFAIGGAGVITFCLIEGNVVYNAASTSDAIINLASTATGIVYDNHGAGAAAQANGFTATACTISQNFYGVVSEDLSAILDPIGT